MEGILRQAWRIVWQNKFLWLFGLIGVAGNYAGNFLLRTLNIDIMQLRTLTPQQIETALKWVSQPSTLLSGGVAFLAFVSLFWLLNLLAEGSIISATTRLQQGEPLQFTQTFADGAKQLPLLIKVDTLLFLPMFLLLLILLLIILGTTLLFGYGAFQNWELPAIMGTVGVGLLCTLPFLLLAVPLTLLTLIFRYVALREAVWGTDQPAKDAIRQSRRRLQADMGASLTLVLVLLVLNRILGWGVAGLSLGIGLLPIAGTGWVALLLQFGLGAMLFLFTSVAWTLGCRQLGDEG